MKKQTKAVRIRKLVLAGFRDVAIAKLVKCHANYVYIVRTKMAETMPMVKPKNLKEVNALLQRQVDAPKSTRAPVKRPKRLRIVEDAPRDEADAPKSILNEAQSIIYGDREKTYGAPDKNLVAIAGYWANHLNTRFGVYHDISPEDVCIMMVLLKAARLGNDITHRDSQVDAVGYLALMERIQK